MIMNPILIEFILSRGVNTDKGIYMSNVATSKTNLSLSLLNATELRLKLMA